MNCSDAIDDLADITSAIISHNCICSVSQNYLCSHLDRGCNTVNFLHRVVKS